VKLSEEKGNVAKAAREFGIGAQLIHRWKKEQEEFKHNSFPGHGKAKLTDEGREIARLKKELRDAKMEAEILKKAIGNVFAAQIIRATAKIWVHEEAQINRVAAPEVNTLLRRCQKYLM
jgi:transposase